MSGKIAGAVWDTPLMSFAHKGLLALLADYSGYEGKVFPSIDTLVRQTQLSKRKVIQLVKDLEDHGFILRVKDDVDRRCNTYEIDLEKLDFSRPPTTRRHKRAAEKLGAQYAPNSAQARLPLTRKIGAQCAPISEEIGAFHDTNRCIPRQEKVHSTTEIGAESASHNRKNRHRTVIEPSGEPGAQECAAKEDTHKGLLLFPKTAPENPPEVAAAAATGSGTWTALKPAIERRVGRQVFGTWFKPLRDAQLAGPELVVRVPTRQFDHLGDRYGPQLAEAIAECKVPIVRIRFVHMPETGT